MPEKANSRLVLAYCSWKRLLEESLIDLEIEAG